MTAWLAVPAVAHAQRARAEVSASRAEAAARAERADTWRLSAAFDHGYGFSGERSAAFGGAGQYLELAGDVRLTSPLGLGVAARIGTAFQLTAAPFAADLGVTYRYEERIGARWGWRVEGALGPSVAIGPFDRIEETGNHLDRTAFGVFGMADVDLWFGDSFVGLGLSAHALPWFVADPDGQRTDPILTVAPQLRVGGEWRL